MPYSLFLSLLGALLSYVLGSYITHRIYRRKLAAAQAKTAQSWTDYQEVLEMAARWKRLYHNLKAQA